MLQPKVSRHNLRLRVKKSRRHNPPRQLLNLFAHPRLGKAHGRRFLGRGVIRYVGYAAVLHMEIIYLRSFERWQSFYHSQDNNRMFERGRRVLRTLLGVTLRKLRGWRELFSQNLELLDDFYGGILFLRRHGFQNVYDFFVFSVKAQLSVFLAFC